MHLLGRYFGVDEPDDLISSGSVELAFPTGRRLTVGLPFKRKTGGVASAAGNRSYAETLKMGLG